MTNCRCIKAEVDQPRQVLQGGVIGGVHYRLMIDNNDETWFCIKHDTSDAIDVKSVKRLRSIVNDEVAKLFKDI